MWKALLLMTKINLPITFHSSNKEWLRHNYLARKTYDGWQMPLGSKVRAGLGYPPSQVLIPHVGVPFAALGAPRKA